MPVMLYWVWFQHLLLRAWIISLIRILYMLCLCFFACKKKKKHKTKCQWWPRVRMSWPSSVWDPRVAFLWSPSWIDLSHLRILVMWGVSNLPCRCSQTVSGEVSWGRTCLKIAWFLFCCWLCRSRQGPGGSAACPFESELFPSGGTFCWELL